MCKQIVSEIKQLFGLNLDKWDSEQFFENHESRRMTKSLELIKDYNTKVFQNYFELLVSLLAMN